MTTTDQPGEVHCSACQRRLVDPATLFKCYHCGEPLQPGEGARGEVPECEGAVWQGECGGIPTAVMPNGDSWIYSTVMGDSGPTWGKVGELNEAGKRLATALALEREERLLAEGVATAWEETAERMRAEVARLTAERDAQAQVAQAHCATAEARAVALDRVTAERDAAEALLETLAGCSEWDGLGDPPCEQVRRLQGRRPPRHPEAPMTWRARFEWKVEDAWIGAYWRRSEDAFDLWICLLPCVPLHITRRRP